jgi:hypothetical protein
MKIIIKKIVFWFALVFLFACNGNSNQVEQQDDGLVERQVEPVYNENELDILPNDIFREKIVSKLENREDIAKFDTLLNALDLNGITYCQFVKRLFELDDSCYALALKKYPDPSQQKEFAKMHGTSIKMAESIYLKGLNLRSYFANYAGVAYSFDQNIQDFCGKY